MPDAGSRMAASVITQQLVSYQVKGKYRGREKVGGVEVDVIDIDEVFSAGPPLPGKRVYPPE